MSIAAGILAVSGASLMLLAAIGVVKLPDVFGRIHAGTKAGSLGLACVLAATALFLPDARIVAKAILAIALQFLTAPVAAHLIGRGAYRSGVPLWEGTLYDELAGRDEELD